MSRRRLEGNGAYPLRVLPTAALLFALAPCLMGFTPFTEVKNVCPTCKPFGDVLQLGSGALVLCNLMAQNADYFVLERFGEYRALPRQEAAAVAWKDDQPRELATDDQILLKNGLVLHGHIVREVRGMYYVIDVRGRQHVAWLSEITSVHHNGAPVSATGAAPENPDSSKKP